MSEHKPQTRTVPVEAQPRSDADRTANGRGNDDRRTDERPPIDRWAPSQVLSTPKNTGGVRYRWIAEYVNGEIMTRNVQSALQEGYVRVRITELPDDFIVDEDKGDGYARTGGLLLMKLPDAFAQQRDAYFRQRSREGLKAANQLQGVAGKDAVFEDRGSRTLSGADGAAALRNMTTG